MIRAFYVNLKTDRVTERLVVFADSAPKAKYIVYLAAKDAGYKPHFRCMSARRAAWYDGYAPYIAKPCYMNQDFPPYDRTVLDAQVREL